MTHFVRHPVRWLLFCVLGGLAASAVASGCSSNGYSPSCPPMVLYDVHDASAQALKARQASETAHCTTPIGHATSGAGGSSAGGKGGSSAGGSSAGGKGGASPKDAGGG